jgi:toxin-antitoxin system PIN domain toxin
VTPDLNVLVAAFRADHVHHERAHEWLASAREACARGRESLTLLPMIAVGFLRVVTSARVFKQPDLVEDALEFIDALLTSPGLELRSAPHEWPLLRAKLSKLGLAGNLVTDAWIAASVEACSEHLVTFDRDFKRLLPTRDVTVLASAG